VRLDTGCKLPTAGTGAGVRFDMSSALSWLIAKFKLFFSQSNNVPHTKKTHKIATHKITALPENTDWLKPKP